MASRDPARETVKPPQRKEREEEDAVRVRYRYRNKKRLQIHSKLFGNNMETEKE